MGKQTQTFEKRFDFYWKSVAIYSVVLILYSLIRGSIEEGTLTLKVYDPLVIFLSLIILFSFVRYLFSIWKSPRIIIGKDYISFKTRFKEITIPANQITKILIGKEIIANLKRPMRIIKIFVTFRKKPFRVRPSSFWNDKELTESLIQFKKIFNK